jgi:putative DNA primase/helicase
MITTSSAVTEAFRAAIEAAGIIPPAEIISDGRLHRFPTNGRHDDDAGWYVLHSDGLPAGKFGCWRSGVEETWCAKPDRQMTDQERRAYRQRLEKIQREREEQERRRQATAAQHAQSLWDSGTPASHDHPYLHR